MCACACVSFVSSSGLYFNDNSRVLSRYAIDHTCRKLDVFSVAYHHIAGVHSVLKALQTPAFARLCSFLHPVSTSKSPLRVNNTADSLPFVPTTPFLMF